MAIEQRIDPMRDFWEFKVAVWDFYQKHDRSGSERIKELGARLVQAPEVFREALTRSLNEETSPPRFAEAIRHELARVSIGMTGIDNRWWLDRGY